MLKNGVHYDSIYTALMMVSRNCPDAKTIRGRLAKMWRDHNLPKFVARTEWQKLWNKGV